MGEKSSLIESKKMTKVARHMNKYNTQNPQLCRESNCFKTSIRSMSINIANLGRWKTPLGYLPCWCID